MLVLRTPCCGVWYPQRVRVPPVLEPLQQCFFTIRSYPFWKWYLIRSESCFGWNHTIHIRKLSENVLRCTTYIVVLCLFCLFRQKKLFCLKQDTIGWSSHMTSLEHMSCLVEHDICNSSVACTDDACQGFRAGKQQLLVCNKWTTG